MNAVVESFKQMGAGRQIGIFVSALVLIVILIFLSTRVTAPVMGVLYSNVPIGDGAKIVQQLEAMNVRYELRADGTQILVPNDSVARIRMLMAGQGLPSQGSIVGYEVFDKQDTLGTSNFVYNVNLIRALEGEISRTIASFANIESARIHLVIPKRELFVKDKVEPTASVVLKLEGSGKQLSKEEVGSIINFVASAVPGLKPTRITVVGTDGTLFNRGGEDGDDSFLAATNQEYKMNYETRMRSTLVDLLEKSVGVGMVDAKVSVEMDFDREITNSEVYDPDGQVARSIQTVEERDKNSEKAGGGEVSVANNLPDAKGQGAGQGAGGSGSASQSEKTDETKNFEISKKTTNFVKAVGKVKKLSIAILVDGTYPENDKGERTYTPREEEALKKIESLVKSAVGFDEKRGDKIEVVNMQFIRDVNVAVQEHPFDWLKRDFDSILKTIVIGVVAVLVILLIIKPLVNRAFEISDAELEEENTQPAFGSEGKRGGGGGSDRPDVIGEALGGLDTEKFEGRSAKQNLKKISHVVSTNPEETLAVMRQWLNQK